MNRILAEESRQIADRDSNPLQVAKASLANGNPDEARSQLEYARRKMPAYVARSPDTLEILIALGDFAEAERLALQGVRRFPRHPHYLEYYALVAERVPNAEEASRRWANVRKKFPRHKKAYVHGSDCLIRLGRLDEAQRLLASARHIFPGDGGLLLSQARLAEAGSDWNEALRLWNEVRTWHVAGCIGAANALHRLGRIAEADALLEESRLRYPLDVGLVVLAARLAEEGDDHAKAAQCWEAVRRRFPFETVGYYEGIRFLRSKGDWREAEDVARAAVDRFPSQASAMIEYARIAQDAGDWDAACERWAKLRSAFPLEKSGYTKGVAALKAAGRHGEATRLLGEFPARTAE